LRAPAPAQPPHPERVAHRGRSRALAHRHRQRPGALGVIRLRLLKLGGRPAERARREMRTLRSGGFRMDAITLLTRDHREVEQLFKQFEKLTERAQKSMKKIEMKMIRGVADKAMRRSPD